MQRRVIVSSWLSACAIVLFCLCGSRVSGVPTFAVSGTRVLKNGTEFVIHGISVPGPGSQRNRSTIQDVDAIVNLWKFNLVRVNCSIRPPASGKEINNLDEIVRAFTARGIVVLIDPRDHVGGYYQDPPSPPNAPSLTDLVNWYKAVAARYRDNPAVWFEVMSAPGIRDERRNIEPWLQTHERVITAIRKEAGAGNIIVCEGRHRGGDAGNSGALPVTASTSSILAYGPDLSRKYANLLYAFHADETWNAGVPKLEDFFDKTAALGLPVFVSEYGWGYADSTPAIDAMLSVCKDRHVGRCASSWFPADNQPLCATDGKGGGWQVDTTDGTKPGNLSWIGDRIWDDNHSRINLHGAPLDRTTWTASAFAAPTDQGGRYNQPDSAFSPYTVAEEYWTSNKVQEPGQWFQVDMGAKRTFTRMMIDPRARYGDFPRGYQVFVSNDGLNWGAPIAAGKNDESVLRLTFPAQTARYIKVVQTAKTWHHWVIADFEVYAPIGAPGSPVAPGPQKSEAALEPRAWSAAAGPHRWYDVDIPLRPLQDENRNTNSGQPQSPGQYYQVDMGEPQRFDGLMLNCGRNIIDYPRGYEVQVSSDGLEWSKPIAAGRGAPITRISFPVQTARFVRVTTTRYGRNYWSLAEFRVYDGAAAANPPPHRSR